MDGPHRGVVPAPLQELQHSQPRLKAVIHLTNFDSMSDCACRLGITKAFGLLSWLLFLTLLAFRCGKVRQASRCFSQFHPAPLAPPDATICGEYAPHSPHDTDVSTPDEPEA